MTDEQMLSSGEAGRALARIERTLEALAAEVRDRHHALANQMTSYIGPVAVLESEQRDTDERIKDLDGQMRAVTVKAGQVSALGTVAAIVAALIPWPWKAH